MINRSTAVEVEALGMEIGGMNKSEPILLLHGFGSATAIIRAKSLISGTILKNSAVEFGEYYTETAKEI